MAEILTKKEFKKSFIEFTKNLKSYVCDDLSNWTIKGFIDKDRNVYSISNDTKVISKILEIHIFPLILKFAESIGYKIVLAECQNYYPDISFVNKKDNSIKFAVDLKSTYRKSSKKCNGFTLGSHGTYFQNRESGKNIQFPYSQYKAHFCLGIIYTRVGGCRIDEIRQYKISDLKSISSVIKDLEFFFAEKWAIASDVSGSGNTANIGSITDIEDILHENGVFKSFGEPIFDDYWINYGKIVMRLANGKTKKITKLNDFLKYKGIIK